MKGGCTRGAVAAARYALRVDGDIADDHGEATLALVAATAAETTATTSATSTSASTAAAAAAALWATNRTRRRRVSRRNRWRAFGGHEGWGARSVTVASECNVLKPLVVFGVGGGIFKSSFDFENRKRKKKNQT